MALRAIPTTRMPTVTRVGPADPQDRLAMLRRRIAMAHQRGRPRREQRLVDRMQRIKARMAGEPGQGPQAPAPRREYVQAEPRGAIARRMREKMAGGLAGAARAGQPAAASGMGAGFADPETMKRYMQRRGAPSMTAYAEPGTQTPPFYMPENDLDFEPPEQKSVEPTGGGFADPETIKRYMLEYAQDNAPGQSPPILPPTASSFADPETIKEILADRRRPTDVAPRPGYTDPAEPVTNLPASYTRPVEPVAAMDLGGVGGNALPFGGVDPAVLRQILMQMRGLGAGNIRGGPIAY